MFDTLVIAATLNELEEKIAGARIQKIVQPSPTEIVISLYDNHRVKSLLISAHPSLARIHLTSHRYKQENNPPNFCMLMRKHLEGAVLTRIQQPSWERIIILTFFRGQEEYQLVAEIMGRHSNIILLNKEEKILGAVKHVTSEMSRFRTVVPGKSYFPPPTPQKYFPDEVDRETFKNQMLSCRENQKPWEKSLISVLQGISPMVATELVHRARENYSSNTKEFVELLWDELQEVVGCYHRGIFTPCLYLTEKGNQVYSALELSTYRSQPCKRYSFVSEMLDHYYQNKYRQDNLKQKKENLQALLKKELKRVYTKEKRQKEEWEKAQHADTYRLYGELILSQMDQVPSGAQKVRLPNLYDTHYTPVEINLDPRLPPPANAERYFNKYRRAQKSKDQIKIQMERTREEAIYLESVLYSLEKAGLKELEEIFEELNKTGYISSSPQKNKSKKRQPQQKSEPMAYTSSKGYQILVGKNNTQNDEVTFRKANREDTWLHAQKIPGSHVIIKEAPYPPPHETLLEAAALAAYHSKNWELPNVTVDYTQVKHVKRAPGGKPGMVFYKNFKSVTVTPDSNPAEAQLTTEAKSS